MARSNKYASINFNEIYEKKVINSGSNTSSSPSPFHHSSSTSSSSSSSSSLANHHSKTAISNSRIHGHMLVLSKPAAPKPKPIVVPQTQQPLKPPSLSVPAVTKPAKGADQTGSESDSISLRPQGRTGSGSAVVVSPLPSPGKPTSPLPKSDRFVPPHLRPGFASREEKPGPQVVEGGFGGRGGRRQFGYPNAYGEDGRPTSGGGYERMRRIGGEPEHVDFMIRPGSSGGRPGSSG